MKILLLLATFLFTPDSHAKRMFRADPGVQLVSLCGSYNPATRTLSIGTDAVHIDPMSSVPEDGGTYCFQGKKLQWMEKESSLWELIPFKFQLQTRELKYPVMICSVMEKGKFQAPWNQGTLSFSGATPPARGKEYGWCADGTVLPEKTKDGWLFDAAQFREFPNPNQRSGMSIGNQ